MSINRATLDGHLGADPEIRTTSSGGRVATFRLATTEKWKDRATGEQKERTMWHSVVVFADWLVDVVEKKLKKGSRAMVEGSIETREYTDKQEVKRWTTEIVVRGGASIVLPVDMPRAEGNRPPPAEDYRSASRGGSTGSTQPASNPRTDLDDDIPF